MGIFLTSLTLIKLLDNDSFIIPVLIAALPNQVHHIFFHPCPVELKVIT